MNALNLIKNFTFAYFDARGFSTKSALCVFTFSSPVLLASLETNKENNLSYHRFQKEPGIRFLRLASTLQRDSSLLDKNSDCRDYFKTEEHSAYFPDNNSLCASYLPDVNINKNWNNRDDELLTKSKGYSLEKQLWLKQMNDVLTSPYTLICRQFSFADCSQPWGQFRRILANKLSPAVLRAPKNKVISLLSNSSFFDRKIGLRPSERGMLEGPIFFVSFSDISMFLLVVSTLCSSTTQVTKKDSNIDFVYGAFCRGVVLKPAEIERLLKVLALRINGSESKYSDFFRCRQKIASFRYAPVVFFFQILAQINKLGESTSKTLLVSKHASAMPVSTFCEKNSEQLVLAKTFLDPRSY